MNGAIFKGDVKVPFTNAIILTRKDLLQKYGFDPHYAKGNGYREETDYQLNIFVNGYEYYHLMCSRWDETKRLANLNKHGLDFADAERVFAGPMVLFEDRRCDYGEQRIDRHRPT